MEKNDKIWSKMYKHLVQQIVRKKKKKLQPKVLSMQPKCSSQVNTGHYRSVMYFQQKLT